MHITIEIDNEAKAIYIRLKDGDIIQTVEYPEQKEVFLDLDAQGDLLAIEILDPSTINLESMLKEISTNYGISDLSSLIKKSLIELAA